MANEVLWVAGANAALIAASAFADGETELSAEFDNSANKDRFCNFEVELDMDAAPAAGAPIYLWILYDLVGDGSYPTYSNGEAYHGPPTVTVQLNDVDTLQRYNFFNIPIAPFKLKVLLWDNSGQDVDVCNLSIFTHNEAIQ